MRNISRSFRFTRGVPLPARPGTSAATDALSAITVWRALDADRSIRVLVDKHDEVLVAELTFAHGDLEAALHDLTQLCRDHAIDTELIAQTA